FVRSPRLCRGWRSWRLRIDAAALSGTPFGRDRAGHRQTARGCYRDLAAVSSVRRDFAGNGDFRARYSDGPAVAALSAIRSQRPSDVDDAAVAAVEHDFAGPHPDAVGADRARDVDRLLKCVLGRPGP